MENKRKGLYVFFEGLVDTVIDSQVLLHARQMKEQNIVDFEIWCFTCFNNVYTKSIARLKKAEETSRCRVRVFRGVRPAFPFSCLINALHLWKYVSRYNPDFDIVHARTDYSAAVCTYLKLLRNFELIWDCRGDSAAEFLGKCFSFGMIQKFLKWYQIGNLKWRIFLSTKGCQRAIFVSNPLKQANEKGLKRKPCQVISCAASEELFYFDEKLRRKTRERLGYRHDTKVIVYCGSLAVYQCYPETIELFRKLYWCDKKYKLLIITPQKEKAKQYTRKLPEESYKVFSSKIQDVNLYLNAADHAVLLRKHDPVNTVASPTKFAEYCLTGLPIIMNDSILDCYAMAKRVGNLCEYSNGNVIFTPSLDRNCVMEAYKKMVSRSSVIASFRTIYFST